MPYFTRVLHVEDQGYLQFTFNCIVSPAKNKYHVSVLTSSPQCYHFIMEHQYGRWKITEAPRPPEWIMAMEESLSQAIVYQHLQLEAQGLNRPSALEFSLLSEGPGSSKTA